MAGRVLGRLHLPAGKAGAEGRRPGASIGPRPRTTRSLCPDRPPPPGNGSSSLAPKNAKRPTGDRSGEAASGDRGGEKGQAGEKGQTGEKGKTGEKGQAGDKSAADGRAGSAPKRTHSRAKASPDQQQNGSSEQSQAGEKSGSSQSGKGAGKQGSAKSGEDKGQQGGAQSAGQQQGAQASEKSKDRIDPDANPGDAMQKILDDRQKSGRQQQADKQAGGEKSGEPIIRWREGGR